MAKATRAAYGEELAVLMKENPKLIVLDADLAKSTNSIKAKDVDPNRFYDMGIAESGMIGHAAGLAASGFTVFANSFAMFASGRAWEQVRNSVAYPKLNVKVVGTHAGITVGEDGVSHQATEDIAIMRVIPGLHVFVPCDQYETKAVIRYAASIKDPCYIRLGRQNVEDVYSPEDKFDFTKVRVLQEGTYAAIFACGSLVQSALYAASKLKGIGVNLTVVDVCAIKPCDEEAILEILQKHQLIFTAEEHSIIGGLGSMISEIAGEKCPRKIFRIGMEDRFAESGSAEKLMMKYGLDGEGVYRKIRKALAFD